MDLMNIDMKKEFTKFNKRVPLRTTKVTGGDFPYRYYKNEHAKKDVTLVFLAGGSGLSDSLFLLYHYFMDKYSIISFNYPKAFATNASLADAMDELFKQLGAKNIYLIGQSYGGLIAQVMAKRHPETIKGLILSGTCSMSNDLTYAGIANIVQMINPKKLEKNLRMDRRLPQWALVPFMKLAFKRVVKDKSTARNLSSLIEILKKDLTCEYMSLMDTLLGDLMNEFGTHHPEDFSSFRNEVMLIFSKEDSFFCDDLKDALIRLMPDPTVIRDLKGGHLALLISYEEYASRVNQFIEERNV